MREPRRRMDECGGTTSACPFCLPGPEQILAENRHAVAIHDRYPLAEGHTLIIPRQHVASVFDLPAEEVAAIWALVAEVRNNLVQEIAPDAFTIGHLFMRSTVSFGCVAGGLFTNWGAVFIYHRHDKHGYEYWFPLSETKRGEVATDPVGAVADAVVQRLTRRAAALQQPAASRGGE